MLIVVVPSSGLILVAKTYAAYFDLRLQLQKGNFDGR
jgi:23S rRNA-/tRNA-specific pseudouridylate synthase